MCPSHQVFIKYFATTSMELPKGGIKQGPCPQVSESVVVHRRPTHLGMSWTFHESDTVSEKGRSVGTGQMKKASWEVRAMSFFPIFSLR